MLIPDLTATKSVDPVVLTRERTIEFLGRVAGGLKDEVEKTDDDDRRAELMEAVDSVNADLADLQSSEYVEDEDSPSVTVGYIPASKLTSIKHQSASVHRMPQGMNKEEASSDLDREVCTWGVKGWDLKGAAGVVPCGTRKTKCRGAEVDILDAAAVDILERMGWLQPLAFAVLEFNRLDEDAKKK